MPLGSTRTGLAVGGVVTGGGGGAAVGTALAIMGPDPTLLLGFPVFGAAMLLARVMYRSVARSTNDKLEGFLDRIEHGELPRPPKKPDWRKSLGMSGARITVHLLHELRRQGKRFGLGSACIGGGQGIAVVVEAFPGN